jgi:hypothetical protein
MSRCDILAICQNLLFPMPQLTCMTSRITQVLRFLSRYAIWLSISVHFYVVTRNVRTRINIAFILFSCALQQRRRGLTPHDQKVRGSNPEKCLVVFHDKFRPWILPVLKFTSGTPRLLYYHSYENKLPEIRVYLQVYMHVWSVSKVTGCRLGDKGSILDGGRDFLFVTTSRPALSLTHLIYSGYRRLLPWQ